MPIFGSLRHVPSPAVASMEQIEPCHCMCAVVHHGVHVCGEEAYPGLELSVHLPARGEVRFPVCEACHEAAPARWHRHEHSATA
ncbi:DUF6372 family protein [Streptomyces gamaensis]|uniref:DUF6372 family protein n=1 Tax=Streptomyces gamaensis TaxID=1763542 RepID=A0ABW0Z778_9ACTN